MAVMRAGIVAAGRFLLGILCRVSRSHGLVT